MRPSPLTEPWVAVNEPPKGIAEHLNPLGQSGRSVGKLEAVTRDRLAGRKQREIARLVAADHRCSREQLAIALDLNRGGAVHHVLDRGDPPSTEHDAGADDVPAACVRLDAHDAASDFRDEVGERTGPNGAERGRRSGVAAVARRHAQGDGTDTCQCERAASRPSTLKQSPSSQVALPAALVAIVATGLTGTASRARSGGHAREERAQGGQRRFGLLLQQHVRGPRDHDLVGIGAAARARRWRGGGGRRAVELA